MANAFGVIAVIWLMPIIIFFLLLDVMFVQIPREFVKYMKKHMK